MRLTATVAALALALVSFACSSGTPVAPNTAARAQGRLAREASMSGGCAVVVGEWSMAADECTSDDDFDRALGLTRLEWRGRPWILLNRGNEIQILDVSDPRRPRFRGGSGFNVGNQGDSDYDLVGLAVCDDCRYGAAWYKMATVLFDLGTGPEPVFAGSAVHYGATITFGGVTYYDGRDQWLVTASGLDDSCGTTSARYAIRGVNLADLVPSGCVSSPTRPILAAGGTSAPPVVWVQDSSTRLYQIDEAGGYLATVTRSVPGRDDGGLAVDRGAGLMVTASSLGAEVWDVSAPLSPAKVATVAGSYDRAALEAPLAFVALGGIGGTARVLDLSSPSSPADVAWSAPTSAQCSEIQSGRWAGDVLYLARYSVLQAVDFAGCISAADLFSDGFENGGLDAWSDVVP